MKKLAIFFLCLTLCLNIKMPAYGEEQLLAKSAVLIDGDNGRILYGKEPELKMAMASTTKIMTCIVALENCQKDKVMTVSENATRMPKVHMNAIKGEQYYMKDLLYAMMLESYNDVAVVIAENIAGSVENFAKLMNKKAKEIGAVNTNFVTPNGLDAEGHYSTAYDMALIGAYAVKNDEFVEIVTTQSYSFNDLTGKRSITASNKDAFLTMDEGAIGIKTGFTGQAGYCFVGAVESQGRLFVSCVLACGWPPNKTYKWRDTKALMNIGKEKFYYKDIMEKDREIEINIETGTKEKIKAYIQGESRMLISEEDVIDIKTEIDYKLPVKKNQTIGSVDIYVNNQCIEKHAIISKESVREYNYKYCLEKTFDYFVLQ